jgi:hypothetical protein
MTRLACAVLLAALGLSGCAQLGGRPAPPQKDRACEALFAETDLAVQRAGVRDGAAARIDGFPHLRVDRLLASFAPEVLEDTGSLEDTGPLDDARFDAWLQRLRETDRRARAFEVANLPEADRADLQARQVDLVQRHGGLGAALDACGAALVERDRAAPQRREALLREARVPDDYDQWKRIVGLYWLTRIPFASGVRGYQREVETVFATPLDALPLRGRLTAHVPPPAQPLSTAESAAILERAPSDALGIAVPGAGDLERLFQAHAPVWLLDQRDDNDRIGRLVFADDGSVRVDTSVPTVYRRVAHTRYGDRVLLQLVYSVWLPARPKTSGPDLLGGHLDALVWRVTLAPDGAPLVYDSIHSCGCYHQFFPTARAEPLPQPDTLDETAFVPQHLPPVSPGQRIALRLEAGTHYLQRILLPAPDANGRTTAWLDDDALRSLPVAGGGRRSAFRPDGIVAGSERGERWLFWPMGVREPGAMRQWGRHATAFVGRRHFDEARLMQRYFRLRME